MDEDKQKLRNFIFYRMYTTDKEREEMLPGFLLYLFVIMAVLLGTLYFLR